jgi:NitT/TauT family transport system permease protein
VISGQYFKIPMLWAAVVTTSALTLILVSVVTLAERLSTPWAQAETPP